VVKEESAIHLVVFKNSERRASIYFSSFVFGTDFDFLLDFWDDFPDLPDLPDFLVVAVR
jgi:hypothetical protein